MEYFSLEHNQLQTQKIPKEEEQIYPNTLQKEEYIDE